MTALPVTVLSTSDFERWRETAPQREVAWATANGFKARPGSWLALPGADGNIDRILCGAGPGATMWSAAHLGALELPAELRIDGDWSDPRVRRQALGYRLGAYRFERYRKGTLPASLQVPEDDHAQELEALVDAIYRVRDLVNTPAEDMGPAELEEAARHLMSLHGGRTTVITGDRLLEENYPAIHAVGRAATREPRLIDLSWGDQGPLVVLVGKGVCFDSGGLDIKGAAGMRLMKKDMGGAAHALGLAELIMARRLPIRLRVLIPAVENAIAGNAYRPGDVVNTRKGLTVEIGNTDAEGRVVLSDALARGSELEPDLMIDFATLTGAARVALGPDLPPLFANDETLAEACLNAGRRVEDPLWRMPLFDPYEEMINTPIADVSNSGNSPMAGCLTAALFLRRFVGEKIHWCHLDVYAWNPSDRPGRPMGGEAQGLRAMYEMLRERFGRRSKA